MELYTKLTIGESVKIKNQLSSLVVLTYVQKVDAVFSYLFCAQLLQSAIESWSACVLSMKTSVSRVVLGRRMVYLCTPLATTSNMH